MGLSQYKTWLLVLVGVLVGGGGFFWYTAVPSQAPTAPESFEPYQTTLQGLYVCLPHVTTSGPQTLECGLGLQATDGAYYALDFNAMPGLIADIPTGTQIEVSGTVTPVERLSSDHWRQYPIKGILSVTDFTKL